jgi:hypothetical protein
MQLNTIGEGLPSPGLGCCAIVAAVSLRGVITGFSIADCLLLKIRRNMWLFCRTLRKTVRPSYLSEFKGRYLTYKESSQPYTHIPFSLAKGNPQTIPDYWPRNSENSAPFEEVQQEVNPHKPITKQLYPPPPTPPCVSTLQLPTSTLSTSPQAVQ